MRFSVWLRNVSKSETSEKAHYHGEFVDLLITTFLVTCSVQCHRDTTELVNNSPYLLFEPLV